MTETIDPGAVKAAEQLWKTESNPTLAVAKILWQLQKTEADREQLRNACRAHERALWDVLRLVKPMRPLAPAGGYELDREASSAVAEAMMAFHRTMRENAILSVRQTKLRSYLDMSVSEAEQQLLQVIRTLSSLQYLPDEMERPFCPVCGNLQPDYGGDGHDADCEIRQTLALPVVQALLQHEARDATVELANPAEVAA